MELEELQPQNYLRDCTILCSQRLDNETKQTHMQIGKQTRGTMPEELSRWSEESFMLLNSQKVQFLPPPSPELYVSLVGTEIPPGKKKV